MTRPKILKALFVHGVGQQASDFADDARHWLRDACRARDTSLYSLGLHWAPLADAIEHRFLAAVEAQGSLGNMTQRLVVGTLADALMYQSNTEFRQQLHRQLDNQIWMLGGKNFTVFAHSLGGMIVTDYLRERPEITGVRLVTMGCNIGLFHLGHPFREVRNITEWHNLYSARDMLGFPLAIEPGLAHVQDREVSVGGWFKGWTGLAHVRYWDTASLWKREIPGLLFKD